MDEHEVIMDFQDRPRRVSFYASSFFAQVCVIAITIMIGLWMGIYSTPAGFHWNQNPFQLLHIHPFLMVIAIVVCSTEAILIYRMLRSVSKPIVKAIHVFLHTATIAIAATALAAMVRFKNETKQPHVFSVHSWFGLVFIGSYVLQYVLGIIFFLLPESIISVPTRKFVLPFHKFFGCCAYICGLVTISMGIFYYLETFVGSAYPKLEAQGRLGNSACIVLLVLGCMVIYITNRSSYKRPDTDDSLFEHASL